MINKQFNVRTENMSAVKNKCFVGYKSPTKRGSKCVLYNDAVVIANGL